jgi:hypothetical protein
MGQVFSLASAGKNRSMDQDANTVDIVSSPMNYRSDLDAATGKPFKSWADKYGPHEFDGQFSTTNQRWDLDDPFHSYYSGLNDITTRGLPALPDTFAAEDIVVVYDGYCASTCTIFSEFMRQQAGVDTIALGGRPNTDIIQAVGGTKGTNNWSFELITTYVIQTFRMSTKAVKESFRNTEISTFNTWLPFHRVVGTPGFNMRDGTRKGDPSGVPLQFIVEPADCRLFYTPDMTVDVQWIWTAAVDVKWFGKKKCVAGGFKSVPSSHADDKKKSKKRATKSKTATAKTLAIQAVAALEDSFDIMTNFVLHKRADGMMSP